MSSKDPTDPRPDAQVEAEEAMAAAEEPAEITHAEADRSPETESAAAYAEAGILGAPGSEVAPGDTAGKRKRKTSDQSEDQGEQPAGEKPAEAPA